MHRHTRFTVRTRYVQTGNSNSMRLSERKIAPYGPELVDALITASLLIRQQ